ncbi:ATP-dependent zinc metalloprotease FtsH [Thiovibrio frasassiensis]|uniref:ATP-dependent zinc metalloprotease FtsH n=1 Tax=Thiovibrio frasassiensis TaxID=2984131 RepID=A0A9X4MDZ2_9BACT|nr:ATP-dependent zinc metalloprotease FtsH [Thiovibrio frasassiensis]MDG4475546.1 ATP-dependent zinc metalloprotease FtsH [Thiovibrio frasassiensis]
MNQFYKNLSIWLVIALVGLVLVNLFSPKDEPVNQISYNDFLDSVNSGKVSRITIRENVAEAKDLVGNRFQTVLPDNLDQVKPFLKEGIALRVEKKKEPHWLASIIGSWLPMIVLVGLGIYFMRQQQGGGGKGLMTFGKSRARLIEGEESKLTFADVAGIEEAREELGEIVDFLRDPGIFTRVGARIPKGVLLSGEPGTGKTLLARAIAGEAQVPFFSISGSDFVEMYVGVGASRVRDLFKEAKKKAPCIVFIDEIDAVGRQRGAGSGGGNDEREQTLNQLLVEMDGFEANAGVIIIAATNRPDILDPALKRPGRFDRQIIVPLPDVRGREKILKVHAAKVQLDSDVDMSIIAKGTPGFSGAELANMVNEAALMAARFEVGKISMALMEKAKDKVMMGAERTSMILTAKDKELTAYHEAGHALVARLLPGTDPVHKVTIIPRGRALGLTMQLPTDEKHSQSRSWLQNNLCILLGGRVAEEIVFGDITTGAGNDIERATAIARKMVCEWGMSEAIGPMNFAGPDEMGRSRQPYSGETAVRIDQAVIGLVTEARETATRLLNENRPIMEAMANALLEKETISGEDIERLMAAGQ